MRRRTVLVNALFSVLFGMIGTTLVLVVLLSTVGLPTSGTPGEFTLVLLGLVVLGGVVLGAPVFVLCQRTAIGW